VVESELEFSDLYRTWYPKVRRWVVSLGAPASDIDDVTQEVFIIVRRKLSGFHSGNLAGWLHRITVRTVRDFRHKAWFRHARQGSTERMERVPANEDLAALYEARQTLKRVSRALTRMTEIYRETFVLFAIQGFSGEEIAELYRIPIATVWSRLHRARKELTRAMRERVERRRGVGRNHATEPGAGK
jgi:RNA polymerase sigma-70 factor, ECF subfamily